MKKTLVIHPQDVSTVFLENIYKNKNFTVVNDCNISKLQIRDLIKQHDRIIMCGHGIGSGLINPASVNRQKIVDYNNLYLIDDSFVDLLKDKETISIWCYSDQFFRRNRLKGFHTGMIISEVAEEQFILGNVPLNEKEINDNMIRFAKIINECIDLPALGMRDYILEHYTGNDPVTQFNRRNIIVL